jgi:hypothetical protein
MTYARFHAAMMHTEQDGAPRRAHLEASARAGNAFAIEALREPQFPDALSYLWEWCLEIRQGLGAGMDGLAALTWVALDAWARRTRREPEPHEVQALFALDGALRTDGSTPTTTNSPDVTAARAPAWPSKKAAIPEAV